MFTGLEAVRANPARRWITVVSFSLQATIVAAVLIFPLLRPECLPDMKRVIFRPLSAGIEHLQPAHATVNTTPSTTARMLPPLVVRTGPTLRAANIGPTASNVTGPPSIDAFGDPRTDIRGIMPDQNYRPMPQPAHVTHYPPVSVMMEGNLLRKVEPRYPAIAVQMGLQGTVVIKALISREGTVEHPQVISGPPFLASSALDAVKEWRYRPYYLNGQPVEVETQITVNFVLNR